MIKPRLPEPGATIAVISPSWGGPSYFPAVYENGLKILREEFGFVITEYPTSRMSDELLHAAPELRARDINNAFADPAVQGIICSIGGNDSSRILRYLDTETIVRNPKMIMGYSDSTTFLSWLNTLGLVTFYGPSVMSGFSQILNYPEALAEYHAFFAGIPLGDIVPFPGYSHGYPDWARPENIGGTGPVVTTETEHTWINGSSASRGLGFGGCIEVLQFINGTRFWPDTDFWKGRVLFLETSEDAPAPDQVGYWLRNFGVQGILEQLSGLVFAKPRDYSVEDRRNLERVILDIVVGEFGCRELNIVTNVDFGHTDPRHIIPLGIEVELDPRAGQLRFTEGGFRQT